MSDLPWLRLYTDTVDNEKLRLLAFEDRWHYIALLCLKQQGVLEQNNDLLDRKVAVKLGIQLRELDEVKRRLIEVDLIDQDFQPIGWDKRQFKSDSSKNRVKKYRENKKKEQCNGDVTLQSRPSNAIEQIQSRADTEQNKTYSENSTEFAPIERHKVPIKKIVDLYHEVLPELPKVVKLTKTRESYIRQRWIHDMDDLKNWRNFFNHVRKSKFLMGQVQPTNGRKVFIADLEWLTKESNFAKIAEGKYHG